MRFYLTPWVRGPVRCWVEWWTLWTHGKDRLSLIRTLDDGGGVDQEWTFTVDDRTGPIVRCVGQY